MTKLQFILNSYCLSHLRNCIACLGYMWREAWNSSMTIIVIGIALALPTGMMTLATNAQKIHAHLDHGVQLTVFFKPDVSAAIAKDKQQTLHHQAIIQVKYISPTQALQEFEQATGQQELLQYLTNNPLPATLIVTLQSNTTEHTAELLRQQIQQWPEVNLVQLDKAWLQRLTAILKMVHALVTIVTAVLALAVFFITSNTIRLNVEKRRQQIIITKLLGATDAFIRREFLYLGFWYGLLGSIIAWGIVTASILAIKNPAAELATLYQSNFQIIGLTGKNTALLFLLGTTLGISGAWVSVATYLDKLALE